MLVGKVSLMLYLMVALDKSVYTAFPEGWIIGSILLRRYLPAVRQGSHLVLTDDLDPCVSLYVSSHHPYKR